MKARTQIIAAAAVAALLVAWSATWRLRFDECAVVTTFGRADEGTVVRGDDDGAGIRLKWPWPVQDVRRFDARLRTTDDQLEQQETADRQVVILRAWVAWRISDPLDFLRAVRTEDRAERLLRDRLRSARTEASRFTLAELAGTTGPGRLAEAEDAILQRIRADLAPQRTGIEVLHAGIRRLVLPQEITAAVFERMRQTRRRMAQAARSEGDAAAREIRARARSAEDRIAAFVDRAAQDLRSQGDAAAAEHFAVLAQDEELALFLRKVEALERALSKETTFVLDAGTPPLDLLRGGVPGTGAPK